MAADLPRERTPSGPGWEGPIRLPVKGQYGWKKGDITVVSDIKVMELPDGSGSGPQWHISVCFKGKRPKDNVVKQALRAFGFWGEKYDEDNHHPGNARHFFLVVDPSRRVDCQCKIDEEVVTELDGYKWTNPKPETGEECRGCEMARWPLGKPCTIHGKTLETPT
jgi:hypothetical protein